MTSMNTSSLEISRLQDVLLKLADSAEKGIKTSQASPKQLVESAFNICKTETIQSNRSLHTRAISLLLCSDDPPDILTFLNKASINRRNGDKEMNEARKEVVVQLTSLFKADTNNLAQYKTFLNKIIEVSYQVLMRENKSATVRTPVFNLLFEILKASPSELDDNGTPLVTASQFKVGFFTNNVGRQSRPLYDMTLNLIGKGAKAYGVLKGSALELLGRLYSVYPLELKNNRDGIYRTLLNGLTGEYAKEGGDGKANIISGAINGLSAAIEIIDKFKDGTCISDIFSKKNEMNDLFSCIYEKTIYVRQDLKRYSVPKAGIEFISKHSHLFSKRIIKNGEKIYRLLLTIFLSKDKKTLREFVIFGLRAVIRVFNNEIYNFHNEKINNDNNNNNNSSSSSSSSNNNSMMMMMMMEMDTTTTTSERNTTIVANSEDMKRYDIIFQLVMKSTMNLLQDKSRKTQELGIYIIGDFAGAMKAKFNDSTQELKDIIINKLLKNYMSNILTSRNSAANYYSNGYSEIYAKGSDEQAMISACSSIIYYMPEESLDAALYDPLSKVLRHVVHNYYQTWEKRYKDSDRINFAKEMVHLMDATTKNNETFLATLDSIVVECMNMSMYKVEALQRITYDMNSNNVEDSFVNFKLSDVYSKFMSEILIYALSEPFIFLSERSNSNNSNNGEGNIIARSSSHKWTCRDELYVAQSIINALIKSMLNKLQSFNLTLKDPELDDMDKDDENEALTQSTNNENEVTQFMLRKHLKEPQNPIDYNHFLNLIEFYTSINQILKRKLSNTLYNRYVQCSLKWAIPFLTKLIPLSLDHYEVSGFYKIIQIFFELCSEGNFFNDKNQMRNFFSNNSNSGNVNDKNSVIKDDREKCFEIVLSYVETIQRRSTQYRDELFVSAAKMILSAPHQMMEYFLKVQTPILQSALTIGRSYRPVAWVAVKALEKWRQTLSDDKLDECLPSILPKLNEYLLEDEEEAHQESKKASKSNAEGRDSLRTYILNFLGRIGGRVHDIVGSSEKDIAKGLRWTSSKDVLKIELIFDQINAKYKLDLTEIIPRIIELAELSGDYDIKTTACEALHTIILYMLPQVNQPELCQIYEKVFPCILRLATDSYDFTRNLFEPLVKQLCHWFSRAKSRKDNQTAPETVTWLNCVVIGASNDKDAALKDVSTRALAEFLKWAIKQKNSRSRKSRGSSSSSSSGSNESNPVQIDSLMRRLFNMLKNPNTHKQIGAANTINLFYRDFREEPELIRKYSLDIIYHTLNALKSNENSFTDNKFDNCKSLGDIIEHFTRIICKNLSGGDNYTGEAMNNLDQLMEYILCQISSQSIEMRVICSKLFSSIATAKYESEAGYSLTKKPDFVYLFENQNSLRYRLQVGDLKSYYRGLEGSLFAYNWAIEKHMIKMSSLASYNHDIGGSSSINKKRHINGDSVSTRASVSHIIDNIYELINIAGRTANTTILPGTLICELFKFIDNLFQDKEALASFSNNTINPKHAGDLLKGVVPLLIAALFYPTTISNEAQVPHETLQEEACKTLFTIASGVRKSETL